MSTRLMRHGEGQKTLLASLKLNFSPDVSESEEAFPNFEKTFEGLVTADSENKKSVLDQVFREFLTYDLLTPGSQPDIVACQRFVVQFGIRAARKGYCSPGTAIQVLSDMFDILTLNNCEVLFKTVEQEVATWREPLFFASGKNNLLRICNDLLRRLSRTQNTVFCGRILLFLAKFFPFSERSGLNVISEFNLDNVTNFNKEDIEAKAEAEEEEVKKEGDEASEEKDDSEKKLEKKLKKQKSEMEDQNLNVDYNLYRKFWQIQDFFRNPVQCYQKEPWRTFSHHSSDVLAIFQSFKLDTSSGKSSTKSKNQSHDQYFSKYLTNQNLLQLQLSDSNFRRYILLQFLILFQYLKSNVKFKTDAQALSSDQDKWIGETTRKIYKLLEETPPLGREFARSVKRILHREEHWNRWKNEGCPSLARKTGDQDEPEADKKGLGDGGSSRKKKRKLGDVIQKEVAEKKINLGNKGLTELWNLNPDNLEACRAAERDFLPSVENYFEEAIEQQDPKNEIEDTYKKVNNGEWGWRALRLMSRRSSHFFISGNNPIAKLPDYLDSMLTKMAKEMPNAVPKDDTVESMEEENGDAEENGDGGQEGQENAEGNAKVTEEQAAALAEKLAPHWLKLAPKFGVADDKLREIKENTSEEQEKCLELIKLWQEIEGEGATKDEIIYILEGLKLASLIDGVF